MENVSATSIRVESSPLLVLLRGFLQQVFNQKNQLLAYTINLGTFLVIFRRKKLLLLLVAV